MVRPQRFQPLRRDIIDTMEENGHPAIETIWVTGGLIKNKLYLQAHADATSCTLVLPQEQEAVLLGAAVLGARAGGTYRTFPSPPQTKSAPKFTSYQSIKNLLYIHTHTRARAHTHASTRTSTHARARAHTHMCG